MQLLCILRDNAAKLDCFEKNRATNQNSEWHNIWKSGVHVYVPSQPDVTLRYDQIDVSQGISNTPTQTPTTAVFSYAIGSRKLLANEQVFVGAQTVVCLLQTTHIKQGVSFIAANKVYTSTNKTTIVWIETKLFFLPRGGCVSYLRACVGLR